MIVPCPFCGEPLRFYPNGQEPVKGGGTVTIGYELCDNAECQAKFAATRGGAMKRKTVTITISREDAEAFYDSKYPGVMGAMDRIAIAIGAALEGER